MAPNFPSHKSKTNSFHISGRYPTSPTPSLCSNLKFEGVSKNGSLALLVSGLRGRHPMATSRRLRTVGSAFATNNGSRTRRRGTERPREAERGPQTEAGMEMEVEMEMGTASRAWSEKFTCR